MLWSSAKFATSEPGSCFTVKVSVCVYVRVHFTHVTDMGQPWLLLWHTPTGRLFSKRIFSELQVTITDRVMWNHLDVGTSFFLPCIINLKKKALHTAEQFFSPWLYNDRQEEEKKHWLTSAAAAWWALSTCSMSLLHRVRDSHMKMQPSATRNNSQDVSVFIYPLHS